jgi:hypothetical protein
MADTLYQVLWSGQYKKQGYSIYRVIKDYDHRYTFWYLVMYDSTLNDAMRNIHTSNEYNYWEEYLWCNHMIDIRQLSTYIPEKSWHELGTKEYVAPIIRNAIRKGEIEPV